MALFRWHFFDGAVSVSFHVILSVSREFRVFCEFRVICQFHVMALFRWHFFDGTFSMALLRSVFTRFVSFRFPTLFFDDTFGSVFRTVSVDFVTEKIVHNSPATGVGARRCTVLPADLRVEGTRRELSREVGGREVPYLK